MRLRSAIQPVEIPSFGKGNTMHPQNRVGGIILALGLVILGGCAAWNLRSEPPGITLAAIRPLGMRGLENQFEMDLRVLNRSDRPLTIQGIDCDLFLNDRNFAQGVGQPFKEIPAYGSDTVTLTVYSSVIDMARLVHYLIQSADAERTNEKWSYALKGNIQLKQGGVSGRIPFSVAGAINVNDLLRSGQ
jgi:LEA14-like dessication related protein